MSEALFDLSGEYESMLNQGLSLSGETAEYFLKGRLDALRSRLPETANVRSVLDFGCGIGIGSRMLRSAFPRAAVTGCDTSESALVYARSQQFGHEIRYLTLDAFAVDECRYELCYVNGVFHHIPPHLRMEALRLIRSKLSPGGRFFYFENNPWNPGTRMVMSRIPFDRDAQTISLPGSIHLLRDAGFDIDSSTSLFFFPRALAFLRFAEPLLGFTRLGAQYLVVATIK